MNKQTIFVLLLSFNLAIEGKRYDAKRKRIKQYEIITRPKIKVPEEEMCLEDYQMTMLEQHNRYRELNFMDPLVVSKKLQYVALLTAQRCSETKNVKEAVNKTSIYFTDQMSIIQNKGSINECRKNAILVSESWFENREYWTALMEDRNYKYLGCAVSIKKEIGCHVCLYQGERGKLKLQQNKVPGQSRIDLDSYTDNFWNSYQTILKCKFDLLII